MLRNAGVRRITPVVLTTALETTEQDRTWRVPKRDLVTGLQVALQRRRHKVAPTLADADLLVRELTAVRAAITLDPYEGVGRQRGTRRTGLKSRCQDPTARG